MLNWRLESRQNPAIRDWKACATLRGRTICTAPFPIFRTFAQTRVHGIHCRVIAATMQVVVITDKVVKRFHLPKGCSRAFQQSVGFAGGEAFPAFQHLAQRPVRLWTKHGMHMVRHHHPCMKVKALTGVEFHCTRNQIGDFGSRQPAITATRVEIFIHTCRIPAKQFFLLVPRQRTFGGAGKKARVLSWLKPLAPAVSRRIGLTVAR